ncbi:hypothetical protein SAMN04489731_108144 [Amycolatopsis regifaucium]|nr:hypothetical protein SAMN04489731_108144 [Amycolatopsis regifaucium]
MRQSHPGPATLTEREPEIVTTATQGGTDTEIGAALQLRRTSGRPDLRQRYRLRRDHVRLHP